MTFKDLAEGVTSILEQRGYSSTANCVWDNGKRRVVLSNPPESAPQVPIVITYRRYERDVLMPHTAAISQPPSEPAHIADVIQELLGNPY